MSILFSITFFPWIYFFIFANEFSMTEFSLRSIYLRIVLFFRWSIRHLFKILPYLSTNGQTLASRNSRAQCVTITLSVRRIRFSERQRARQRRARQRRLRPGRTHGTQINTTRKTGGTHPLYVCGVPGVCVLVAARPCGLWRVPPQTLPGTVPSFPS